MAAGDALTGWSGVDSRLGYSLVITTSGRMVVIRSCSTAAPQAWQAVSSPMPFQLSTRVDDQGQLECSSVTSFQCLCAAIAFRASNHSPAAESPTRATVSTGWAVSPNTHSLGLLTGMSSRQPAVRYSDWLILSGGG